MKKRTAVLEWLVDGRVPTPEELHRTEAYLFAHFAVIAAIRVFPPKAALVMLIRSYILMEAMEEGVRRVKEAMLKAMKEDPVLALLMMLSGAIEE